MGFVMNKDLGDPSKCKVTASLLYENVANQRAYVGGADDDLLDVYEIYNLYNRTTESLSNLPTKLFSPGVQRSVDGTVTSMANHYQLFFSENFSDFLNEDLHWTIGMVIL